MSDPSRGNYTIVFPSTAAAIATYTVQIFVYETPRLAEERASYCQELMQGRRRKDVRPPVASNQPVNICDLLQGRRPITVDYGDRAIVAVAQRRGVDFLIGCTLQTIGDGDALMPIDLGLVDIANPVPDTTCNSVGDFCAVPQKCTSQ